MSETREEQAKRLDAYAELCYGDSPVVQANRDAFRAGAEALRGPGWQDISTAPKDGTNVLLWWPFWCKGRPTIGWFGLNGIRQWVAPETLEGDGDPPTYWMPLPPPPVAEPEPRA